MNAYTTFIKTVFSAQSATEDIYFYLRMELALSKLQLCKELGSFQGLKVDFQQKFSALTAHVQRCLQQGIQQLKAALTAEDQLRLSHLRLAIANLDFDKEELDYLLSEINFVFAQYAPAVKEPISDAKPVISLSA